MDIETIKRVLDEHLETKDAKLVQNFVNIFKESEQASMDLHEKTTGVRPDMVKAVPFVHRGLVYDGGYVPNNYLSETSQEKTDRFIDVMGQKSLSMFGEDGEKGKLYSALRSAEQTEQGRLLSRTGSAKPLDTNFMNFIGAYEEIAHDLAYRESGVNTLKLLRSEPMSNAIKSVVGESKYQLMNNAIIETVGKASNEDALNPFSKERNLLQQGMRRLEQGFAIKTLGFKLSSVLMQPLSLGSASLRMGKGGATYIAKSMKAATEAIAKGEYQKFQDIAIEINPDLEFNADNIDDTLTRSLFDELPKTQKFRGRKALMMAQGLKSIKDLSMKGLETFDIHIKGIVSMGAYAQFLEGNVEGFPQSKLDTMTEAQKVKEAKRYLKQIADLALTTSAAIDKNALEKVEFFRMFTRFYTDVRSQYLTAASQGRKAKLSGKQAISSFQEGDSKSSFKHGVTASKHIASLMAVQVLTQVYTDLLRGEDNPVEELTGVKNFHDFKKFIGNTTEYIASAPANVTIGSIPIARDIQFAAGGRKKTKNVRNLPGQVFSDMTNTIVGLNDLFDGDRLTKVQKKAFASTASYALGGIPVNGPIDMMEKLFDNKYADNAGRFIKNETKRLVENIDQFVSENKDDPKQQENIKALESIKEDISQKSNDVEIKEDTKEKMKFNKWNDIDPDTGAAGIYQFTEERWEEIERENPELNLSDEGRYSQDTEEQEKAMDHELKRNAKNLAAVGIVVNNQSLYGAHRFGLENYINISISNNNDKLSDIVEDTELFKGFTTVKSVKDFISKKIKIDKK
jgi:hypothetical protein